MDILMEDGSYLGKKSSTGDEQRARKRHRARHTKSRHGCFSCKLRRVKCDESRPVCGACSSRGEPCSFPDPSAIANKPTTSPQRRQQAAEGRNPPLKPNALEIDLAQLAGFSKPAQEDVLTMDNLKLVQFYHMHTAAQMSLHAKRSHVWQRVIPTLAGNSRYLMHLLLALGGIHMIIQQAELGKDAERLESEMVDLRIVMEHHQHGLRGFREEVSRISQYNAEAVYAGSLLLAAFVYASLQVPELNPPAVIAESVSLTAGQNLNRQPIQEDNVLQFDWLHLIRGISSVISDQWGALKASRLRQMVLHFHADEYWKDLPFDSSLSRLGRCSPRLLAFAQGASQAITNLRTGRTVIQLPTIDSFGPADSPISLSSSTTSYTDLDEPLRIIDILEAIYSRVVAVLQCSISEQGFPDDADIQANLEEAAVLSWPCMIPSDFISFLVTADRTGSAWKYSLVILAHFYIINTLVDRWYLNGSLEGEIFKIHELIRVSSDAQLAQLMLWPVEVVRS